MKRVKELGGVSFVQDPDEAEYSDMPRNSIATALVDHVLPVAAMPRETRWPTARVWPALPIGVEEPPADRRTGAARSVQLSCGSGTGHDFSNYKRATVLRRVHRRMGVHQVLDLASYAHYVREHPEEAQALLKDLLISVTNFFRDRGAFEALERNVVPKLFLSQDRRAISVRVWVAGCATGEEAYSIAMLLAEHAAGVPGAPAVQVFATDIDEDAIAIAREGIYTINDAADVSPERLRRFFQKEGDRYRVRQELREMVLFAHHNVIKDPPFSHLDLVSCRNLLIYLNRAAQQRVMEVTHFALNPAAYLFLGSSESVEGSGDLFVAVDKDARIFQSRAIATRISIPIPDLTGPTVRQTHRARAGRWSARDTRPRLAIRPAPAAARAVRAASIVVNEEYEIVHLSESAGRYLQFAGGEPSHNSCALSGRSCGSSCGRRSIRPPSSERTWRREASGVRHRRPQCRRSTSSCGRCCETNDTARGFFLVVFEESREAGRRRRRRRRRDLDVGEPVDTAHQLEDELVRLKAQLRDDDRAARDAGRGAEGVERRAAGDQRGAAVVDRGARDQQGGAAVAQRGADDRQSGAQDQDRGAGAGNNDIQNLINSTEIGTIFLDRPRASSCSRRAPGTSSA